MSSSGSRASRPDIPGIESAITAIDVFRGGPVRDRVVVCGGGLVGCEVAWYLAELGREVTIVEMLGDVVLDMETGSRMALLKKLRDHVVEIICGVKVEEIIPGRGMVGIDRSWRRREIRGDTVVLAMGFDPDRSLFDITDKSYEAYLIGDAKEPRRIIDAIREADHIARYEI
jgi:pyruvate/2-oxoglutarate dehydrogenase complex dihydrolipoamide dehydrogenase (E3) component